MKAEEFNTLDQLFCEAIRYPPGPERQRVLNEQCPEPLRHALHRLLAADAAMPTMTITAPSLPELGGYQAEERIGVGGSGIVYRARRIDGEGAAHFRSHPR